MEQMLPSAMVPGLVTVKDSKGKTQNLFPIDAKELIAGGEYTLVENGAAEAARINANPLRSGRGTVADPDLIVAEVTGIAGMVSVAASPEEAAKIIKAGDNADFVPSTEMTVAEKKAETPPPSAAEKKAAADKEEADKAAATKAAADKAAADKAPASR